MTTTTKRHYRQSHSKQATSDALQHMNNNDLYDLTTDHMLVAPYEMCTPAIGFYSILMNRHIIDMSFSKLYQQSLKMGWEKIFMQERQKLKPNDISVLKCFVLNRLLYEYSKDANAFIQQTKDLYDEMKMRMTREFPQWTSDDLFCEVRRWQDMQCRRRLFYFNHREITGFPTLLMLQKAATNWCYCLINYCRQNPKYWETEGRRRFTEHFKHSFIIVAQPTGSDGGAVTQYTKSSSGHIARLNSRIICLLDPDILKDFIELPNIAVTLYPLNREANDKKEEQSPIQWEIRKVMSAEGVSVSIYCAETHTLQLEKFDDVCKRLSLNSTICQLEYQLKIKVKNPKFEEELVLTSQPFGICSHAQYYPKFAAQIFLYEMKQILNNNNQITDPDIITEFIRRYYTRIIGIEPTDHTTRYIRDIFAKAIDDVKSTRAMNTLDAIYEEILAKIMSQIDFMALQPVLSLMYHDSLFLGICNSSEVDNMLHGTREQPHMLLRFNTCTNHQWNTNPIVQFIIHDSKLNKASFDMKTFANEMCRFICETVGDKIKDAIVLSTMSPRNFSDFQWYFHDELYRLNKMEPRCRDAHDPLLPILWMTMRRNYENDNASTDIISESPVRNRKRKHSDSLPYIDSVSSVGRSSTVNAAVALEDIREFALQTNNRSTAPTNNSSPVMAKTSPLNDQQDSSTNNRQFLIEVPGNIDISPAVIFRYLANKFDTMPNDTNDDVPINYLVRPTSATVTLSNVVDANGVRYIKSPFALSPNNSNSSSEISKTESDVSNDIKHSDTSDQLKIKDEPYDVDNVILDTRVKL